MTGMKRPPATLSLSILRTQINIAIYNVAAPSAPAVKIACNTNRIRRPEARGLITVSLNTSATIKTRKQKAAIEHTKYNRPAAPERIHARLIGKLIISGWQHQLVQLKEFLQDGMIAALPLGHSSEEDRFTFVQEDDAVSELFG
jgi:hypothetical protein